MWKAYSKEYLKQNRAIGASVTVAAFIAAMFLAFLCGLFYNFWQDALTKDEYPRLVMSFYLAITAAVCLSMVLVIYNAFAFTMNARVRQFGILATVGATPAQIRICLLQEAFRMTIRPILLGIVLGVILCRGVIGVMVKMAEQILGGRNADFSYPPVILVITFVLSAATVLIAAWISAGKISRMPLLAAIRGSEEIQPKADQILRFPNFSFLSFLFGLEGELAGNFLKAQRKAFRTTTLSLTLSFLGFMLMQCFFTLSDISTEETYFARYQDVWDIMVTVHDAEIGQIRQDDVEALRRLSGVDDAAVYQKGEAVCKVPEAWFSEELLALGGIEVLTDDSISSTEGIYTLKAPVVILDDESFQQYYQRIRTGNQAGLSQDKGQSVPMEGTIVINKVWDSLHSNFRNRLYIPFMQEDRDEIMIWASQQDKAVLEVPILAYEEETPLLREEYEDYVLIQVMPQSYWERIKKQIGGVEQDTYIRILADKDFSPDGLTELVKKVERILGRRYVVESENRLQEKIRNDEMINGYKLVVGSLCALLAIIGIANVFSNTLGFLRIRKREVARYLSVGLTPGGVGKMFALEAVVIIGRPLLVTAPLVMVLTGMMLKASYLNPMVFIKRAPIGQIMIFIMFVFTFVALAYYLGGRRVLSCNISEVIRDDMMD